MRSRVSLFVVAFFVLLLPKPAHAQFTVFDPTNYANAVQEFHELQQLYTTALETRDEIVDVYNLAYQMSQMPANLAERYQSVFSQWTNLSAPDIYGNTTAWINSLNTGDPSLAAEAYEDAVIELEDYPAGNYSSLDAGSQATIANQYATSELAQGMTTSTLATLGTIRSDSETFAQKLANLEADTYSSDPSEQTEVGVLGKINTATLLQVHSQQDANQMLAASIQQQLVTEKQQIDQLNRLINQAIYFQQNFPNTMQQFTGGVSDAMKAISLSPSGR